MPSYIKVTKGEYKDLKGYIQEHAEYNAVVLYDENANQILTTLKPDTYEIIEVKVF